MKRLSLFAIFGILCYLVVLPMSGAAAAQSHANLLNSHYKFTGAVHKVSAFHTAKSLSALKGSLKASAPATTHAGPAVSPVLRSPLHPKGATQLAPKGTRPKAPHLKGQALANRPHSKGATATTPSTIKLIHGFNGISTATSTGLNGLTVTPPDQGLCVGNLPLIPGDPQVVIEAVNLALRITTLTGTLITQVPLATVFSDPTAYGDVRCLYDSATKSFYLTELHVPGGFFAPTYLNTADDIAVVNANGIFNYMVPSSETGNCLGDQPKTGFDGNALVISTDEYCGAALTSYGGALVNAISLPDLDVGAPAFYETFRVPTVGGLTALGLDPGIGTPGTHAYMVNSFAYQTPSFTVIATTSNLLGVWTISTTYLITYGVPLPLLTGQVIGSESYAFPVPAKSTTTTTLNPDDDRTSGPVAVTVGKGGAVNLWTAVTTSVLSGPTAYNPTTYTDGAAWFEINPLKPQVTVQGYVSFTGGVNFIYPAMAAVSNGPVGMVGTATAPTGPNSVGLYPSALSYMLGSSFGLLVGFGSGSQHTFAYRWGDYSFAQAAFNGGMWMATEYIPPQTTWLPTVPSNWGTYVFEVAG